MCVAVVPAHLDRPFDYLVPVDDDERAVPGCRVRVRFAGRLVDGFLLERAAESAHPGRLAYLDRVVSAEPVVAPEIARLAREVADRYAGTLADVLRLAIPPRHARVESEPARTAVAVAEPEVTGWGGYPRAAAYLDALRAGKQAHAVWQAVPGEDWPARLAEVGAAVAARGRGVVIVVPDHRDVARLHAACTAMMGADAVVALGADLGPAERYRRWLRVRRGSVRVAVGTRATMFAPVADPGLLVVWDDGDDLHADPRAPYPQVRDVLAWRAHLAGASLLVGGFARTAEAQLLVQSGWAHEIVAERAAVRAAAPRVSALDDDSFELARDPAARAARLPAMAFDAARTALRAQAPVLVQVPRRGYVPALACGGCRAPARCRRCAGPLALPGGGTEGGPAPARCRWCGAPEAAFRCPECGSARLRAVVVGARRTAEELGRAFPGVTVRTSGGGEVLPTVAAGAALIVATPGAEPVADGGYGAAVLLDGWAMLSRADLRAAEETLRRWMAAAALVRSAAAGGRVVVMAESSLRVVQALVRWDPGWHAARELAERHELGFPPAVRMAAVDGAAAPLGAVLDGLTLPEGGEVLGPVPVAEGTERVLLRVPRSRGRELAAVLAELQAGRAARKEADTIRVRMDPLELV